MKILHTADLHLLRDDEKRMDVLKWLIKKTNELRVNYLIIAGDLFESDTEAVILRQRVKKNFEISNAEIILLPGNHDPNSFAIDYDYGRNVHQLIEKPFSILTAGNLKFCAIPYQDMQFADCIKNLPCGIDILIAHGLVFDKTFIYALHDEKVQTMSIYPAHLENIARYVALGHIHSQMYKTEYKETKVVYPGSPIALNTKCQKERVVMEIDIDESNLTAEPLLVDISPFYKRLEYFVYPGTEERFFINLAEDIQRLNKRVMPEIIVNGFIGKDERSFSQNLKEIEKKYAPQFSDFRITIEKLTNWGEVIKNPLIKRFVEKTEGLNDELRMEIFEISLPVFSELLK